MVRGSIHLGIPSAGLGFEASATAGAGVEAVVPTAEAPATAHGARAPAAAVAVGGGAALIPIDECTKAHLMSEFTTTILFLISCGARAVCERGTLRQMVRANLRST